jgi:hypothetical protein
VQRRAFAKARAAAQALTLFESACAIVHGPWVAGAYSA